MPARIITFRNAMSSDSVKDEETGSRQARPSRAWLLVGLLVAAVGIVIMVIAGSGGGVSEDAQAREDSVPLVETAGVQRAEESYEVRAPGRLRAREQLEVVSEVSGKVTTINPDLELGGRIGKGEVILQVDDGDLQDEVARAEAQLSTAKARREQARAERDRQLRLAEIGAAPEKAAEQAVASFEDAQAAFEQAEAQLQTARRRLEKAVITAPFDAIVTSENVAPGTFVSPSQPLATLISAGPGEIQAGLPSEDVSAVRAAIRAAPDGRVEVRAVPNNSSLSSATLTGYLAEFSPVIDQNSRTATVIGVFPEAFAPENEGDVFSDDFMDIVIPGLSETPVWQVPAGAVRQDSFIWVIDENEETHRISVAPIDRSGNTVLLHAPDLSGGERVMTTVLAEEIEGMRVHVSETSP
ncbi:efflux RND transporter periplasmic adaptor subunit [Henriciella sp.]|uniref:efflux RND transporter periplasmic adaptor subunit n=1 Tax=Henriciella sp. TaxID=1968823 RepID=UPI0026284E98|nr:efflux RND transporter periplasmic adaptor subunit [Henriciella sp.]